jgi:hypothetical protein
MLEEGQDTAALPPGRSDIHLFGDGEGVVNLDVDPPGWNSESSGPEALGADPAVCWLNRRHDR